MSHLCIRIENGPILAGSSDVLEHAMPLRKKLGARKRPNVATLGCAGSENRAIEGFGLNELPADQIFSINTKQVGEGVHKDCAAFSFTSPFLSYMNTDGQADICNKCFLACTEMC